MIETLAQSNIPGTVAWAEARAERAEAERDAANAARVAAEGPAQIAMGHGLVDVDIINPDGRYALTFRPRAHFIPVGQQHGKMGGSIEFAPGDVIIWLDGEEFGDTIINKLNEGRAYKAALTPAPEAPTDGE